MHTVRLGTAYLIMLVVMTYNVGLCLAVLAGAFVGFFLFSSDAPASGDATGCH